MKFHLCPVAMFFRHSEPSSIDFFGYFGTIVFKLVLLSSIEFLLFHIESESFSRLLT